MFQSKFRIGPIGTSRYRRFAPAGRKAIACCIPQISAINNPFVACEIKVSMIWLTGLPYESCASTPRTRRFMIAGMYAAIVPVKQQRSKRMRMSYTMIFGRCASQCCHDYDCRTRLLRPCACPEHCNTSKSSPYPASCGPKHSSHP